MANGSVTSSLQSRRFQLFSSVTLNDLNQSGGPSALDVSSRQLSWYEQFTATLPAGFRAELYWRYQDNQSEYAGPAAPSVTSLSNLHKSAEFDLKQQLYDSLLTTYVLRWDSNTSNGGVTTSLNNNLNFSYTKQIHPVRGRLSLGLSLGTGETENTGQSQVVDEAHPGTPVPGAFLLQQPGGDPASVVVFVRSPLPPFELVRLVEGLNYSVATVGNLLEITVVSLPPDFPVPGTYDFRVSYGLLVGEFKVRINTFAQSGSLSLFDNRVTPYYAYTAVTSDVLSGTYPGGGIDSRVLVAGLSYFNGPLRGRVEYEDVTWATSPWQGWRAEVQYIGPVTPLTNVNGTVSYRVRSFEATAGTGGLPAYTERITAASGSVQHFFFSRTLAISLGGSYSHITGLTASTAYTANLNLSWKVGRIDVLGGANYSNNYASDALAYSSRTVHQIYYVRIRRMLF